MALSTQDQQAIKAVIDDYLAARNDRNAEACADLYVSDGDLLAADGNFLATPSEIER